MPCHKHGRCTNVLTAGTKLHTFVSGCVPGAVSGPHTLDETYVALLTGDNTDPTSVKLCEAHAALAELFIKLSS